jgi:hypothetical protein
VKLAGICAATGLVVDRLDPADTLPLFEELLYCQ